MLGEKCGIEIHTNKWIMFDFQWGSLVYSRNQHPPGQNREGCRRDPLDGHDCLGECFWGCANLLLAQLRGKIVAAGWGRGAIYTFSSHKRLKAKYEVNGLRNNTNPNELWPFAWCASKANCLDVISFVHCHNWRPHSLTQKVWELSRDGAGLVC